MTASQDLRATRRLRDCCQNAMHGAVDDKLALPVDWVECAEQVVVSPARRVLILGPADAGKSTFCRALLATAAMAGRNACLIDTDLGQKLVGPPACATLGRADQEGSIDLSELVFVGSTDPVQGSRDLLRAIPVLTAAAQGDLAVVNTSGLLSGPGRWLKARKIEAVAPDLIVGIGNDPDLTAIIGDYTGCPVMRIASSPHARPKTAAARRAARRAAFNAYFSGSAVISLDLVALRVCGRAGNWAAPLPGLLVGFADSSGRDLGLGVVRAVAADGTHCSCQTPVSTEHAASVRWGRLTLDDAFSESRYDDHKATASY